MSQASSMGDCFMKKMKVVNASLSLVGFSSGTILLMLVKKCIF